MQGTTDTPGTMEEPEAASRPPAYRVMILTGDEVVTTLSLPDGIATDEQARAVARAMVSRCAVELWDGLRFIERFDEGVAESATANPA